MRHALTLLHRTLGLALAGFLALAGGTGAVIALYHELDEGLNPHLYETPARGAPLGADALVARVEGAEPAARVAGLPLDARPGRAAVVRVVPRDAAAPSLAYDELFVDPVSGAIVGRRLWGACCFAREQLVPFLYSLHYSLHLPERAGVLVMGCVGVAWALDCFVALALTFPRGAGAWRRWLRGFRVEVRASRFRLWRDVHQATGLWLWGLLLALAVSGVALSLRDELFRPAVALFSPLSPSAAESARQMELPSAPRALAFGDAVAAARRLARERGWPTEPVYAFHSPELGGFGVGFVRPGEDAAVGLGASWITLSDRDLRLVSADVVGTGTLGDAFVRLQFPLHSGHLLGLPGRIAISVLGIATAVLSATGVYVWAVKRAARRSRRAAGLSAASPRSAPRSS